MARQLERVLSPEPPASPDQLKEIEAHLALEDDLARHPACEERYADILLWAGKIRSEQRNLEQTISSREQKQHELTTVASARIDELHRNMVSIDVRVAQLDTCIDKSSQQTVGSMQAQLDGLESQFKELVSYCVSWNRESRERDQQLHCGISELRSMVHTMQNHIRLGVRASSEATTMDTDAVPVGNSGIPYVAKQASDIQDMTTQRAHINGQGDRSLEEYLQYARDMISYSREGSSEADLTLEFVEGLNNEAIGKRLLGRLERVGWTWKHACIEIERVIGQSRRSLRSQQVG